MDIKHRISVNSKDSNFLAALDYMRIEYMQTQLPGSGGKLITILILESDPCWNSIVELVKTQKKFEVYGKGDMFETVFSEDEIRKATWLRFISTFEQGDPQPKPHWPLKQQSRELTCPKCALYKQTNPMRLAKEPHMGRKSFVSLFGTNEILCVPEVVTELKKIQAKGYKVWNAVIHKTGQPSEKVRQLFIPGVASPGVIFDDDLVRKTCSVCGNTKYYPHEKGVMHLNREALLPNTDFMLTNEWFGFGLVAWREILVSNRVARLILNKGWRGVRFKVVEVV